MDLILSFTEWLIGNIFVLLASLVLWTHLHLARSPLNSWLPLYYYITIASFFVFGMGIVGLLTPIFMTGTAILGITIILFFFRASLKEALSNVRRGMDFIICIIGRNPSRAALFCIVIVLISIRMIAHIWILSPYIWDTLSYHLPKVADWVQQGKLVAFPTPVTRSYWPAGFELFQAWFVVFFHHDFLIEAAGLPYYLLAIGCVYAISRSLNLSRSWSCCIAILYSLTPSVLLHAVSCKNDIGIAALFLFSVALLLEYNRQGERPWIHLTLLISAFMVGTGIKPYMVFLMPGLMIIAVWRLWNRPILFSEIFPRDKGYTAALMIVGISMFLCFYWYFRNYLLFKNPFYPTDFSLFGQLVFGDGHGHGQQGSFQWKSIYLSIRSLIEDKIFDRSEPYTADLGGISGWGWFAFACGLPASLIALIMNKDYRWLSAGFLVSLLSLLGFVQHDGWNMRFTLWFPALLVIGFGIFMESMRTKIFRSGLIMLAIACAGLNYTGTLSTGYTLPAEWKSRAETSVWRRTIIPEEIHQALRHVPAYETLAYFTHGNAWIYPLYGPDYSRHIRYLPMKTNMDVPSEMMKAGVRYLLIYEADNNWNALLETDVSRGRLRRITKGLYTLDRS